MLKFFSFVVLAFCAGFLGAQTLDINSQYNLGSLGEDGLTVYPSPNGDGYYLIGSSDGNASFDKSENSRGDYDVWVVKTDTAFVKQWDKTFGGTMVDAAWGVVVLDDRIIISSRSKSDSTGEKSMNLWGPVNIWNICIDLNGSLLWQYQYGGTGGESAVDVIPFSDSSVLMAIESFSDSSGNKMHNKYGSEDIWLVEAAISDGHIIQQNNVGATGSERFPRLAKAPVSGKIFMVTTSSPGADFDKTDIGYGINDIWLTEIDTNLQVVRDKCFGGTGMEDFPRIMIDADDNIVLSAQTQSDSSGNKTTPRITTTSWFYDCWIVKVDQQNFSKFWDKSYAGTGSQGVSSLQVLPGGEVVVNTRTTSLQYTGNMTSESFGGADGWVLFLDENGDDLLQASFGGTGSDVVNVMAHPFQPTKLIFTGSSDSPISGNKTVGTNGGMDAWIGILEYDGLSSILELAKKSDVLAFPNPSHGEVSLQFKEINETVTVSFVSVDGKLLETVRLDAGTPSVKWKTTHKGIVFYSISGEHTQFQGKLVFE